jgi:hypothetical protein
MRCKVRSGAQALAGLALGLAVCGLPGESAATGIALRFEIELGPQREGNFGSLSLENVEEGVEFTIVLNRSALGSHANLHEFYLSLPHGSSIEDEFLASSLHCEDADSVLGDCSVAVEQGRTVRGGAGADFDFRLNFDAGNARIQLARFVLAELTVEEVLEAAFEDPGRTGRALEVLFAAQIQGSGHGKGSASATVGVPIPEPATAALFACGLAGLAFAGRRMRR